jgi:hypothetical protein
VNADWSKDEERLEFWSWAWPLLYLFAVGPEGSHLDDRGPLMVRRVGRNSRTSFFVLTEHFLVRRTVEGNQHGRCRRTPVSFRTRININIPIPLNEYFETNHKLLALRITHNSG